jgi:hypothetical protein
VRKTTTKLGHASRPSFRDLNPGPPKEVARVMSVFQYDVMLSCIVLYCIIISSAHEYVLRQRVKKSI